FEEVVQALGQPIEESPSVIEFETAGGYGLEFHFGYNTEGVRELIAITISSPESRK
ncbi:MAG: hypothetical protein QG656_607, partial [Candidatus Hydrogenedentes bacterium]|nr:hypothetical protein [Candidatus Hydrogenedentota bacterium]